MIEIDGVLIGSAIFTSEFVCNLTSCKGACCWEGDYGAPVDETEMSEINRNLSKIKKYLSIEEQEILDAKPLFEDYKDQGWGTSLRSDGSCVFLTKNSEGIAVCTIEKSFKQGESTINKPISCHLYPIRVLKYEEQKFEAWNYETWDICKEACSLGEHLKIPVYKFLKDAIVRYKGQAFYEQMDAAAVDVFEKR